MKLSFKQSMILAAKAGLLAALLNAVLFYLFSAAGIISPRVLIPQSNGPLSIVPVVLSSIIPALLAGVAFYLLVRYTKAGYKYFFVVSIILLLFSFVNPFMGIPGIPLAMGIALNVMHVVVVMCLLYIFRKTVLAVEAQGR